ncbi:MAG: GYF domain-containing protein [Gemmataceae bacterium]
MPAAVCPTPQCSYAFSPEETQGRDALVCPRCGRETFLKSLDLQLDPPPLPVSTSITREAPAGLPQPRYDDLPVAEPESERFFFLLVDDRRLGPLKKRQLVGAGLDHLSLVWHRGAKGWRPARSVAELDDILQDVPPPAPGLGLWAGARNLPQPATLHRLYGWLCFTCCAMLFFVAVAIAFAMLFESTRVFDFRGFAVRNPTYETLAIAAALTAGLFAVVSVILFVVLLHQIWSVIQDGYARLTPGLAVGLLFIPFFNVAWIFFAIALLPQELNLFARRHGYDARPASSGLAVAHCICLLIPFINFATLVPLGLVNMATLKNSAADLIEARLAEETPH